MRRVEAILAKRWGGKRRFRPLGFLDLFGPGINTGLALVVAAIIVAVITRIFPVDESLLEEGSKPALDQVIGQVVVRYGLAAAILTSLGSMLRAAAHQQDARSGVDQLGKLLAVVSGAILLWGALLVTARFRSFMDFLVGFNDLAEVMQFALVPVLLLFLFLLRRQRRAGSGCVNTPKREN